MTVANMPMASAVGRDSPVLGNLRAAQNIAAADHDAEVDAEPVRGDEIGGETIDGRLVNAELFGAAQRLAGELDDHPSVVRLRHRDVPPSPPPAR